MNFQQLEYVLAVDSEKHFARAAEQCHVTQATLSAMVKRLEEELGIVLFDRSHKPVVTTDEGLQFIERARNILSERDAILQLKNLTSCVLDGELRIGIIPTVANSLLPLLLPRLLGEHPDLKLSVVEITTEEIVSQLVVDRIDIGILVTPLHDDRLDEQTLYYESMMVYGVKDRKKKFVHPSELADERIWLLEEGNCFRHQSITICDIHEKAKGIQQLDFEGSSFDTLLNLTDRFGGYTLVPELYYNLMPVSKRNRTAQFKRPLPVREVSVVTYRPQVKSRAVGILKELIQELVAPELITSKSKARDLSIIGIS
jgi:LysR family hydrogen peroxide-inducible transcriptional activator